jgi:hypothetical protein
MPNEVNAQKPKLTGYGLVRNAAGEPQFDDYADIPEHFHPYLTTQDWIYINSQRKVPCQ